jgi:phage terminase large subunit GpA-like protein
MTLDDQPPWASEPCPACRRSVVLGMHELSCPCSDHRTRVAVAWICDHCDLVVDLVGLFTSWAAALSAHQHELDGRAGHHLAKAAVKPDR